MSVDVSLRSVRVAGFVWAPEITEMLVKVHNQGYDNCLNVIYGGKDISLNCLQVIEDESDANLGVPLTQTPVK